MDKTPTKPATLRSTFETHPVASIKIYPVNSAGDEELFLVYCEDEFSAQLIRGIIYIHFDFADSLRFDSHASFFLTIMEKENLHHIMVKSKGSFSLIRYKASPFAN